MSNVSRQIGRYELVREVGRGGMAVVYVARQTGLDREVAVKELAAFHVEDPAFVDRFLRESRLAGSLGHPNIVTVYDYFEHENVPYIAMEYLERGSLRPFVGRISLAQVGGVMEGVLAGLYHAGRRSVVHRDLKPENLLVTDEGGVKIADFGIAKALNQASLGAYRTATGMAIGTPAYMAPEQATAMDVGPWTDLYTTGVIAYELLVGRVPFGGVDTPMAVLWKHVHEPPPPPQTVKPDLDPALAGWLERMLAKDPANRPRNALAAWEELEEIVIGILGPRWRRDARLVERGVEDATPEPLTPATFYQEVTPDTPAAPPAAPPPPPPPPAAPPPPEAALPPTVPPAAPPPADESFVWPAPERRRQLDLRQPAIAAVLLVVALLISGAIYVLTQDDDAATPAQPPPATGPTADAAGAAVFADNGCGGCHAFGPAGTSGEVGPNLDELPAQAERAGVPLEQFVRESIVEPNKYVEPGFSASMPAFADLPGGQLDALVRFLVGAQTGEQPPPPPAAAFERVRGADAALGGPGNQAMKAITSTGRTAVGGGVAAGDGDDAALWRFADGAWSRIGADALSEPGDQVVRSVATREGTTVAVGSTRVDGDLDAAIWILAAGEVSRTCDSESVCGDEAVPGVERTQEIFGVTATPDGFVAVGRDTDPGGGNFDAAVWRSSDGLDWERVALPADGFSGERDQVMQDVVASGNGLVAAGREALDAAVWRSPDGVEWERVKSDTLGAAPGAQEMFAIVAGGPGLVVVGYEDPDGEAPRDAAVWVFDGIDWRRAAVRTLARDGGQEMRGLALVDGVLVAGGADRARGDEDAAVWTSQDGLEWQVVSSRELGGVGLQAIQALAQTPGGGTLAVGEAPSPTLSDQDAAVWLRGR